MWVSSAVSDVYSFSFGLCRYLIIVDQPRSQKASKNVHWHGMLIVGTHVKSISHRPDRKTRVDVTKYFDLKGHFKVIL